MDDSNVDEVEKSVLSVCLSIYTNKMFCVCDLRERMRQVCKEDVVCDMLIF